MAQLAYHLQVEGHPLVEALRLEGLANLLQVIHLRAQVHVDLADGLVDALLRGDEQVGGIDVQLVLLVVLLARLRVEGGDAVDLVVPELDAVGHAVERLDGGEDVHRIAVHPEASALELQLVIDVERVHEAPQQLVALDMHPSLDVRHLLGEGGRVRHAVEARDGRDDDDVPPPGEERRRGPQAQLVDLVVDRQILLDIGIRGGQVGLRLVVIVVGDEILHGVVREKGLELAIQLRGERLVVAQHERGPPHLLDDVGDGEGLARAGHP